MCDSERGLTPYPLPSTSSLLSYYRVAKNLVGPSFVGIKVGSSADPTGKQGSDSVGPQAGLTFKLGPANRLEGFSVSRPFSCTVHLELG